MSIYDIFKNISSGDLLLIVIILLSLVEVTPLKLSPWGWLGRMLSRFLGIEELSKKVDELDKTVNRNNAITCRIRILRFSDEMYNNCLHSKESFEQVLRDIDIYEQYCSNNPEFKNGKTVHAIKHIEDVYNECLEKHTFKGE